MYRAGRPLFGSRFCEYQGFGREGPGTHWQRHGRCRLSRGFLFGLGLRGCLVGRLRLLAELGDRLREDLPLGRRLDGPARRRNVVPAAEEGLDLGLLLAGHQGPDSHVSQHVLIVRERPFADGPGVVAVAAVHGEELSAGNLVLPVAAQLLAFLDPEPQRSGLLGNIHRRAVTTERRQGEGDEHQQPCDPGPIATKASHRHRPHPWSCRHQTGSPVFSNSSLNSLTAASGWLASRLQVIWQPGNHQNQAHWAMKI